MAKVVLSERGAKEFEKGIVMAQENPSFRDHVLDGKWEGYRAASLASLLSNAEIKEIKTKSKKMVKLKS